jgi:acyl-[acyl carrier protein]--UDP-N-acetylglucosamine O-acyltransferase
MNDTVHIHPTAIIETDVSIGDHTSIWDAVHIRHGASLGRNCIVGEKTYIAYDVRIGDLCKINANVYLCAGVTLHAIPRSGNCDRAHQMKQPCQRPWVAARPLAPIARSVPAFRSARSA